MSQKNDVHEKKTGQAQQAEADAPQPERANADPEAGEMGNESPNQKSSEPKMSADGQPSGRQEGDAQEPDTAFGVDEERFAQKRRNANAGSSETEPEPAREKANGPSEAKRRFEEWKAAANEGSEPGGRRRRWTASEGAFARGRGLVEGIMPDALKKLFVAGLGALFTGEEGARRMAAEFSLPKDAASFLLVQVQNTKRELFRIVAGEIRDFLENVNLGAEIQRILTSLTFEVKMQIRLKPSDDAKSIRPDVRAGIQVKTPKDGRDKQTPAEK